MAVTQTHPSTSLADVTTADKAIMMSSDVVSTDGMLIHSVSTVGLTTTSLPTEYVSSVSMATADDIADDLTTDVVTTYTVSTDDWAIDGKLRSDRKTDVASDNVIMVSVSTVQVTIKTDDITVTADGKTIDGLTEATIDVTISSLSTDNMTTDAVITDEMTINDVITDTAKTNDVLADAVTSNTHRTYSEITDDVSTTSVPTSAASTDGVMTHNVTRYNTTMPMTATTTTQKVTVATTITATTITPDSDKIVSNTVTMLLSKTNQLHHSRDYLSTDEAVTLSSPTSTTTASTRSSVGPSHLDVTSGFVHSQNERSANDPASVRTSHSAVRGHWTGTLAQFSDTVSPAELIALNDVTTVDGDPEFIATSSKEKKAKGKRSPMLSKGILVHLASNTIFV